MMNVYLCRVDDRLVHGQITAAWTRKYNISNIFVVDDELAGDRIASKILTLTVPSKIEVQVVSSPQMAILLQRCDVNLEKIKAMLLFRSLHVVNDLLSRTGHITDILTIGGISSKLGRQEIERNLFLSEEEQKLIEYMAHEYQLQIILQTLPDDTPIDIKNLLSHNNK